MDQVWRYEEQRRPWQEKMAAPAFNYQRPPSAITRQQCPGICVQKICSPHEIITRTSAFWLGLEFRVVRLVFTVKLGL